MTVSLKPVSQVPEVVGSPAELDSRHAARLVAGSSYQSLPVHDFKDNLVDVHGVGIRGEVVELPDLGVANRWVFGDRVRPHLVHWHAHPSTLPSIASAGPSWCLTSSPSTPAAVWSFQLGGANGRQLQNIAAGVVGSGATAGTTRNSMIWPVVSGSATSKSVIWLTAAEGLVGAQIAQHVIASWHIGEVHDHVGALRQTHEKLIAMIRSDD